jgi:outer membrane protein OmpA-like peptidoglycan-associated protein/tetratricopeptide (TPR) repeat protein
MKIFLLFFSLLLLGPAAKCQWYDPAKVNAGATAIYTDAIIEARNENYARAIRLINEAIKTESAFVDAYLSLGGIYANLRNYTQSVTNFEKAFSLDSVYSRDYNLPYSISLAGTGKFPQALAAVNKFLQSRSLNDRSMKAGQYRKKTYEFAIEYDRTHPQNKDYNFSLHNLGDSINTADLEYFPSLTIDGKKLIFTRRIKRNEDFYESDLVNGKWSTAHYLEGDINTPEYNEGAQNVSQDGQWLVFTGCNMPNGLGSCDIFISYLTRNGWSKPQNLGKSINSEFWESSPCLSPDKKDLYFSSDVPGGYGGKDIWVSHRQPDGRWGEAINAGKEINTAGDETCPFIHADNKTLYFNSTGHAGYSDKPDLFISRRQADKKWGPAENLGYPINTIDDEGSMIVSSDGKTAYYSSDKEDSKGGLDIYTFELRQDLRPLRTLWVKGKVYDKKTKEGLPSTVELADVNTRTVISRIQTDEEGNYLSTLPVGNEYAFNVSRKGYLFYSEHFDLSKPDNDSVFVANIPLQPIEANASIVLKNVFFDTKKTELKPASIVELDNVVRLMNDNPKLVIQIAGYTDNVGKPADNLVLSNGRAASVVNYLVSKGVKKVRLKAKGFGETHPVVDNKTEQGRATNRRTELRVVSNG